MGGIPFMSKGCILCRKRKIKCDERKPQCAKCTRRGEPCPGYEGPRFIPYRSGEAPGFTAPMRNRRAVADPNQAIAPGPVVREQITSTFFHSHFPIHHGWRTLNPDVFPSLFAEIASLPRKTSMLQKAIAAISCVFLGKMNVDHRMLRHGSQLYNNAVGHMSHALSRQFYTDELLYTAIIFQELEAIYCPNNLGAFVMHVVGISSILKRYRPQILAAPLTAAIYHKHHKLKVFITNFLSLSDDDYEYLSQPALGDPLLELFQIMADIGLLYKKGGSIFVSNDGSCQEFLSNCLVLQEKQMAWYHRWEGRIGWKESTYGPGELNSNLPPTDQWFGPAYKFPSLESAKLHIFFWMGSMILCPLIHKAWCLVISKARNPGAAGSPTDDQTSSIFYADRVARSLPYCSQAGMNTRGSYPGISTTSHLAMIYSAAGCWEKYTWTKQVFVHMSNCGYGVAARGYDIVSTWWLRDNPPTDRNAETEDIDPDQIWRTKPHRLSLGFQAIKDGLSIDGSETTPVE